MNNKFDKLVDAQECADESANALGGHVVIAEDDANNFFVVTLLQWIARVHKILSLVEVVSPDSYLEWEVG